MNRRIVYIAAAILIGVFPLIAPNDYILQIAQDIFIFSIGAMGLNLLLGYSGQLSLGQAGFLALGAYGSAIVSTNYGWPLWLSIPLGLFISGLAGAVVGLVALRARTHYLAVATLAFGFIIEVLAQRWVGLTGGSMGLLGVPMLNFGDFAKGPIYFFWCVAGAYLVLQVAMDYVSSSTAGRNLKAIKESESFAVTVGINVRLWRAGVFVVAAILAGLSGIFFAHQAGYVSSDAFSLQRSILLLVAVVIGGLGRSYGALLGAIVVVLLNQWLAGLYDYKGYIFGGILLLLMLFFPAGAAGAVERLARLMSRSSHGASDPHATPPKSKRELLTAEQSLMSLPAPESTVLKLDGVTKSYAGVVAVSDVSFTVRAGKVHALIGPNGAGKSTLINVISGLYRANEGTICYLDRDVTKDPPAQRAKAGLTRTFQNLQLIGTLTVIENVMLGLPQQRGFASGLFSWLRSDRELSANRAEAMRLLEFFGIARFADELPGDLAYGHRKLCELARALAQRPVLVLLDEPIAGLNEEEVGEVAAAIQTLKKLGIAILLVEHNMSFVMELSDTVTVLDYGCKIAEGSPAEVQKDDAVISAYLGQEVA